ncbi:MAG: thioredoxin domain-containing protein [Nitrosomonadales bacterium]|nr:thioredoxin domain-containing protein [Nitrosomonadales bacterium]
MPNPAHSNRLLHETSPYLRQHADNPVDWYPWNEEALATARRDNKPILLSIGYSACHWCHVMAHESFEDAAVAQAMNELFVCIKVDREERPDLDKIYQTAHQVLAQRPGGWPLTMFLSPDDHMPFFGGTYFPKTQRHGLPGFVDVLQRVATFYREHPQEVRGQNEKLREIFGRLQPPPSTASAIATNVLPDVIEQLKRQYDARFGGFGQAPKFPHPTSIDLCWRHWARRRAAGADDPEALTIAKHTLRSMAQGGIYDQVGGGFCRYSVDDQWMIPHFEKMLYDNGQLLPLYADAYAATGETLFKRTAIGTAEWVMREMQAADGGYYSSLDADSEGHEGKFYVWEIAELKALLTPEEWQIVEASYGLRGEPNFEDRWHLHTHSDPAALVARLQLPESEIIERLDAAKRKLYAARAKRMHLGRDDKILTSWNALMIKAMARAARRLERPDFLASAQRAFDFIRANLWKDGRLLATAKDGKAQLNAYLDDYVFLIDAGLELLQAQWRDGDLSFVQALADVVLKHYVDPAGGFYFTSDDHETLVYRPKPVADDAIPSGNGIAAQTLLRLGHLLADAKYLEAAETTLKALYTAATDYPAAHGALVTAIDEYLSPPQLIVLRGRSDAMKSWLTIARATYAPWRLTFAIPDSATDLPTAYSARPNSGKVIAYLCEGHSCAAPLTTVAAFRTALALRGT